MISIPRLFGLLLLFLFFEVAVWVLATLFLPDTNVLLVCAAMTAIAVAVWVVYIVVMRWMMRPRIPAAPRPVPGPAAVPALPGNDPESANFRDLVKQAEERLGSSPAFASRKQKPTLAQMPLYLIAGSDAPGKTSAILNSGIDARLLAGESYREGVVTPTPACNFYYVENAVLVDVGSRVFDSGESWNRLLSVLFAPERKSLLRRIWEGNRSVASLRGVVLFCNAGAFLRTTDPQRVAALSHRIQERLDSLGKQVGTDFPLYALFAKADALPYFDSFFYRLSEEEDRQIVGCTLPAADSLKIENGDTYNEAERKRLSKYFSRLCASLANKRLPFLARETVTMRKPSIYEFPRELKRIRPEITNFLVETFRPNPLQPGARLRGFYFSGIRNVAAAQAVPEVAAVSQARFGSAATVLLKTTELHGVTQSVMRPAVGEQTVRRWVFLTKLFRDVVLPDSAFIASPKPEPRLEMLRAGALGAAAFLCLLLTAAFVISLANNRQLLRDVEAAAQAAEALPADAAHPSMDSLQRMDSLRDRIAVLEQYRQDGPPLRLRWGLYSGNRALNDARAIYFAQFRRAFLGSIMTSLTTRFNNLNTASSDDSYDQIYESLKVYRTISTGACRPDQPMLSRVLPGIWLAGHALDPQAEALARRQIAFYASELTASDPYEHRLPEDAGATRQAQAFLLSFKGPEQVYRALIGSVNQLSGLHAARLVQYAPEFAQVLTGPSEVPPSFTRQGWSAVKERIRDKNFSSVGESCVVGRGSNSNAFSSNSLQSDVQNLYIQGYIRTWRDFLGAQNVIPYHGVSDAVHKLDILSGNRSPVLGVIAMIADNVNLPVSEDGSELRKNIERSVESSIGRLFPKARKAQTAIQKARPSSSAVLLTETDIANVFQPVRTLVGPGTRERLVSDSNRTYINALAELKTSLDALPRDRAATLDVSLNSQARQSLERAHVTVRDAAQKFNINTAQGTDVELARFLDMPIDFTESIVPKDPHKPLRDKVNGQLRAVCAHIGALQRKFPFNSQAEAEVTEQELASVFSPGTGALWSFQQLPAPLTGLLMKQGEFWMQSPAVQDPRLTPEFLDWFNRLANISAALYPAGSARPHIPYTVQALSSEGVQSVRINVGGTAIASSGHAVPIAWPPPPDGAYVDLQLVTNGVSIPFGRYEGQWAIFRMMQDGEPQSAGSNIYLFRSLRQGHGKPQQVTTAEGAPVTVRIAIDFPAGFDPRHFRSSCPAVAAN